MQDFIELPARREPIAFVRTFVVLGLLAGLFTSSFVALG
jgi:hypothetical protein